jgi:hypothetical protein
MDIREQGRRIVNRKTVMIGVCVILTALTGWMLVEYFQPFRTKPLMVDASGQAMSDAKIQLSDIKTPVYIFFPTSQGLVREERTVTAGSLPVKMVESLLAEYFSGFKTEMKNTVVRGVYRDRNRIFYIDLSDDFRRHFSGNAAYEYYLLKSIYQTVVSNVSEARDVKILIEGREVESVGGHMMISAPLQEAVSF